MRPVQECPSEMVERLTFLIRTQFCPDVPDKKWFSLQNWYHERVILWPARFMQRHGFTLPVARYEQIMRDIFMDIKHHGNTAQVRTWHSYLLLCVQRHFEHHWEDYYREAKSARALAETALLACQSVQRQATVEPLAQAAAILAQKRRKKRLLNPKQMPLL